MFPWPIVSRVRLPPNQALRTISAQPITATVHADVARPDHPFGGLAGGEASCPADRAAIAELNAKNPGAGRLLDLLRGSGPPPGTRGSTARRCGCRTCESSGLWMRPHLR